jgi:ribonuclease HI
MKQTELASGVAVVDGDSDSDNPNTAVVLGLPDETIADVEVPGTDKTVADYNPDYDADEPAVTVAFEDELDTWTGWQEADSETLHSGAVARDIRTYSYPAARLKRPDTTTVTANDSERAEATTTATHSEARNGSPNQQSNGANTDTGDEAEAQTAAKPGTETDRATLPGTVTVWFDGACEPGNPGGHGTYGIVIEDDDGTTLATDRGYIGKGDGVTNNVAEYTGLIEALEYVHDRNPDAHVTVHGDSQLAIRQMTGQYRVRSERLRPLWQKAQTLARDLAVSFEWVPREQNEHADSLSRREYHERAYADEIADRKQRAKDELVEGKVDITPLPDRGPDIYEVKGKYVVNLENRTCTGPDFEHRGLPCKHIFEVELSQTDTEHDSQP